MCWCLCQSDTGSLTPQSATSMPACEKRVKSRRNCRIKLRQLIPSVSHGKLPYPRRRSPAFSCPPSLLLSTGRTSFHQASPTAKINLWPASTLPVDCFAYLWIQIDHHVTALIKELLCRHLPHKPHLRSCGIQSLTSNSKEEVAIPACCDFRQIHRSASLPSLPWEWSVAKAECSSPSPVREILSKHGFWKDAVYWFEVWLCKLVVLILIQTIFDWELTWRQHLS